MRAATEGEREEGLFSLVPVADTEMGRRHLNVLKYFGQESMKGCLKLQGGQSKPGDTSCVPDTVPRGCCWGRRARDSLAILELMVRWEVGLDHMKECVSGVCISKRRKAEVEGGISGGRRTWKVIELDI